jgi:hypothetical protein
MAALTPLGIASGCGAGNVHPSASHGTLGGPAPALLAGTFTTTITRRDIANAPNPGEMPLGSWTLVIGNTGGTNNGRALALGPGDSGRDAYRFGVNGNRLTIGCDDDQGLPSAGSETFRWSVRGRTLLLKAVTPWCKHGGSDNEAVLSSHPWTRTNG